MKKITIMTELAKNITGGSVYVLFNEDEVVYVGQSKNPCSRIASHNKDKIFTAYRIMQCRPDRMLYWESVLIAGYNQPKYNKTCPKKGGNVVAFPKKRKPQPQPRIVPSDGVDLQIHGTTSSCPNPLHHRPYADGGIISNSMEALIALHPASTSTGWSRFEWDGNKISVDGNGTLMELEVEEKRPKKKPIETADPPDAKAEAWMKRNPWFGKNRSKTHYAFGLHQNLVRSGVDTDSDAYYYMLDKRLKSSGL